MTVSCLALSGLASAGGKMTQISCKYPTSDRDNLPANLEPIEIIRPRLLQLPSVGKSLSTVICGAHFVSFSVCELKFNQIWMLALFVEALRPGAAPTAHLYKLIRDGKFPRPPRIGIRAVGWDSVEVDQWIADQLQRRRSLA